MSAKPSSNDFGLVLDRQLQLGPASSSSSSRSSYFGHLSLGVECSCRAGLALGIQLSRDHGSKTLRWPGWPGGPAGQARSSGFAISLTGALSRVLMR